MEEEKNKKLTLLNGINNIINEIKGKQGDK